MHKYMKQTQSVQGIVLNNWKQINTNFDFVELELEIEINVGSKINLFFFFYKSLIILPKLETLRCYKYFCDCRNLRDRIL